MSLVIQNDLTIFITGGAGYLGRAIIERYYDTNKIIVYSRDEAKHHLLKKEYPSIKTVLGDISDLHKMKTAARHADIGIFAASMKQIEAVDQNHEQAIETIVLGAINSRAVAEEIRLCSSCFISSDKSRAATTLYGSMKFVAGESFIVNAEVTALAGHRLSTVIYGNVTNSTGSIIPMIWNAIRRNLPLTLYGEEMTRFMITKERAVDLIEAALLVSGYNVIPKLDSFKVEDLFKIYAAEYGLKYTIGEPRISEKIHEIMIAEEEMPRVFQQTTKDILFKKDTFYMHYKNRAHNCLLMPNNVYSSKDCTVTQDELFNILAKEDFYE